MTEKAVKAKRRRRRRWWELHEGAKAYVEKAQKKLHVLPWSPGLFRLPKGFLCYHFHKDTTTTERLYFAMVTGLGRSNGAFSYDMLEIDRVILRIVKRGLRARGAA